MTTILPEGKETPKHLIADRTLSVDSCTAWSGKPTIKNTGNPLLTSTSTSMGMTSKPQIVADKTLAIILTPQ